MNKSVISDEAKKYLDNIKTQQNKDKLAATKAMNSAERLKEVSIKKALRNKQLRESNRRANEKRNLNQLRAEQQKIFDQLVSLNNK